jgi:hypothetical protein
MRHLLLFPGQVFHELLALLFFLDTVVILYHGLEVLQGTLGMIFHLFFLLN